jgi:branched-chain amino acid transport system permease protein
MHRLMTCRFGRALTAIRENELAAEATGVDTTRYKIQAFVLAAFYAGIAGSFYAHFVKYISPDSFTINESFILLAMLAFGGQGNLSARWWERGPHSGGLPCRIPHVVYGESSSS